MPYARNFLTDTEVTHQLPIRLVYLGIMFLHPPQLLLHINYLFIWQIPHRQQRNFEHFMKSKAEFVHGSKEDSSFGVVHLQNTEQVIGTIWKAILHISISPIQPNILLNYFKIGKYEADYHAPSYHICRMNLSRSVKVIGRILYF